jgi:hypothetical protein
MCSNRALIVVVVDALIVAIVDVELSCEPDEVSSQLLQEKK